MGSQEEVIERRSRIIDIIAKNGPQLVTQLAKKFEKSRQTISGDLDYLVNKGCLRTITVTKEMREKNNWGEGAGPLYDIDVDEIEDCNYIEGEKEKEIRRDSNEIREYMIENDLLEDPNTGMIKDFLREFLQGGRFEDRDEVEIKKSEMNDEGLSQRELIEFYELWLKVMSSDTRWSVEIDMNLVPEDEDADEPDVLLMDGLFELREILNQRD